MGHGQQEAATQPNAIAYEERSGGDTIQRAAGHVVHDECDAAALRRPRHVGTARFRSCTKAVH